MKQLILSLVIIMWSASLYAQDSNQVRKRSYKVFISTRNNLPVSGYLHKVVDTAISLTHYKIPFNPYSAPQVPYQQYTVQQIREVKLRRTGAAWRGAVKGAVVGMATGVATGFLLGDDKPSDGPWSFCLFCTTAGEKAVIGGITGVVLGGLTGTLIGTFARKRFIIGGDKKAFDAMRLKLIEKVGRVPPE